MRVARALMEENILTISIQILFALPLAICMTWLLVNIVFFTYPTVYIAQEYGPSGLFGSAICGFVGWWARKMDKSDIPRVLVMAMLQAIILGVVLEYCL